MIHQNKRLLTVKELIIILFLGIDELRPELEVLPVMVHKINIA